MLVDYLVSADNENALVGAGFFQTTVRDSGAVPDCIPMTDVKGMDVSYPDIVNNLSPAKDDLSEIFLR